MTFETALRETIITQRLYCSTKANCSKCKYRKICEAIRDTIYEIETEEYLEIEKEINS